MGNSQYQRDPFEPRINNDYGVYDPHTDRKKVILWDDLRFPATAINPPGMTVDPLFDNVNIGFLFEPDPNENTLYIIAELPHTYKEGSYLKPHIHWEPTNTNAGNVLWRMTYRWRNRIDGKANTSFIDLDILASTSEISYKLQVDSFGAIEKNDATISSMLDIKLQRIASDTSDTYDSEALFKGFDIHYQIDSVGTYREYYKGYLYE